MQIIDTIIKKAIRQHVFPGAVVIASYGNDLIHSAAYGTTMYKDLGSQPVQINTYYDIASLTKIFTYTVALQLVEGNMLELNKAVTYYLPQMKAREIKIHHLFTHTSGLSTKLSEAREYEEEDIIEMICNCRLHFSPGEYIDYASANTLILGKIVTKLFNKPLDSVIKQQISVPLKLENTCFLPKEDLHNMIAPTEWDKSWRKRLVHGFVHDDSAYALGGVAGHAGLFSTAMDLWNFCLTWLHGGYPILKLHTVEMAIRNHTSGLQPFFKSSSSIEKNTNCTPGYGLGWMLNRPFMGDAPLSAYGHSGFTGPIVINIPCSNICIVFLTNCTYPQRGSRQHHNVVAEITNAVLKVYSK
ncbi:MAG: beta-lactamase family protein [Clostridiales bacterium]|nr:beta-lactamase family protein [Clostridiales bacterium]